MIAEVAVSVAVERLERCPAVKAARWWLRLADRCVEAFWEGRTQDIKRAVDLLLGDMLEEAGEYAWAQHLDQDVAASMGSCAADQVATLDTETVQRAQRALCRMYGELWEARVIVPPHNLAWVSQADIARARANA